MNDDLLLSLYLDGRTDDAATARVEQRLAAEPALRAELEALRRLDHLSEELPITAAEFDAQDIRARAALPAPRTWWRPVAAGIAAVLVLAVSHGGAYLVGAHRGAEVAQVDSSVLESAEAFLERVAQIDAGAPYEQLRSELGSVRASVRPQLIALTNEPATEPEQSRVAQLTDALFQLEFAFDASTDPGFQGLMVARIARGSLEGRPAMRLIPATADTYTRVAPVGNGRFRVFVVTFSNGVPQVVADEGTAAELKSRHTQFRFIIGGTK